ncbi:MAG: DUF929 family protein [Candidatus Dormibacter sp.]
MGSGLTSRGGAAARLFLVGVATTVLLAACGEAAAPLAAAPNASGGAPTASTVQGFKRVFDQPRLSNGHPLTLFVGGQFCPFCASMRWPLVKAMSRFGSFSGLGQITSQQGTDGFNSIWTYDLTKATFHSDYVTLRMVEVADVKGNPLQQPDAEATALLNQFDPKGSIPFVFVGGSYVAQLPYSPALLQGKSFQQILDDVNSSHPGEVGRAIDAEADAITAIICKTDVAQPATVCNQPGIQALTQRAP